VQAMPFTLLALSIPELVFNLFLRPLQQHLLLQDFACSIFLLRLAPACIIFLHIDVAIFLGKPFVLLELIKTPFVYFLLQLLLELLAIVVK
jgi:hypothetical protein